MSESANCPDLDVRLRRYEMGIEVEKTFLALPPEEREAIIGYGTALRVSALSKRLFIAESKVRYFEEKYKTTLAGLDAEGLADDASYEAHEDYIMWHHWAAVANKAQEELESLHEIAQQGLPLEKLAYAGN
jgi:hypothetical protein